MSRLAAFDGGTGGKYRNVVTTPEMQSQIADAYTRLPEFDPAAVPAFRAMRDETAQQFEHLTAPRRRGGLGMEVNVTPGDPYAGPRDLFQDIRQNNRLNVLSAASTGGHPFFTNDENEMFRAVHDFHGHFGTGRGFDRHGEEAAYQRHSQMYSPLARQAAATELRGQNAFLIKNGSFPVQKVALLPKQFIRPTLSFGSLATAAAHAAVLHKQQFDAAL